MDLADWPDGGRAEWLLPGMSDGTRVEFSAAGLLERIRLHREAVLERHAAAPPERYNDDKAFRSIVTEIIGEMLETLGEGRVATVTVSSELFCFPLCLISSFPPPTPSLT